MRLLTILIAMDNDAFAEDPAPEVARILNTFTERLDEVRLDPPEGGRLRDSNGNTVGRWHVTSER